MAPMIKFPGADISGLTCTGRRILIGLCAHDELIVHGPREEKGAMAPVSVIAPTVKEKAE